MSGKFGYGVRGAGQLTYLGGAFWARRFYMPLLLDHFEPDDVLVTERVNGRSEFNRLDRGELEEWLKDYSLGQLWEKNEIGGRPAREEGLRDSAR